MTVQEIMGNFSLQLIDESQKKVAVIEVFLISIARN